MVQGTFLSRVFGSMGLALGTVSSEICLILASCGSQADLPAFTLVGGEGVGLLLFVPGRGEPSAWELMKVSARPGMQLWEPEREWWRETKSSCHKLACHHVPGGSRCVCKSCLLLPLPLEPWPWRELHSWPHPSAVVGNHSGLLCQLPG